MCRSSAGWWRYASGGYSALAFPPFLPLLFLRPSLPSWSPWAPRGGGGGARSALKARRRGPQAPASALLFGGRAALWAARPAKRRRPPPTAASPTSDDPGEGGRSLPAGVLNFRLFVAQPCLTRQAGRWPPSFLDPRGSGWARPASRPGNNHGPGQGCGFRQSPALPGG